MSSHVISCHPMSVETIWSKLELTLPGALNGRRPGAEYFLSQICGLVHLNLLHDSLVPGTFKFTKHDLNMQNFRTFGGWFRHSKGLNPCSSRESPLTKWSKLTARNEPWAQLGSDLCSFSSF